MSKYEQLAISAFQDTESVNVLKGLHRAQVAVIALKGLALLRRFYASEQRPMYDIDLLVHKGDLQKAEQVLIAQAYTFSEEGLGCTADFAREFMGEVPYRKGAVVVELHSHLVAPQWMRRATAFDLEGIWSRAVSMQVGGAPALRLCPEDEVIHLCYHTAVHHGLAHRQGYEDIVRVAQAEAANLDWDVLAQRARAWKVSVAVWAALRAACAFDEAAVPERALQALRVPRWRQRILRPYVQQAVDGRAALVSGSMRFLGVLLIDRVRDLPGVLWRGLFPGRRWIQTRFDLTGGQARWRQITYPLEIVWRGLRALF